MDVKILDRLISGPEAKCVKNFITIGHKHRGIWSQIFLLVEKAKQKTLAFEMQEEARKLIALT